MAASRGGDPGSNPGPNENLFLIKMLYIYLLILSPIGVWLVAGVSGRGEI